MNTSLPCEMCGETRRYHDGGDGPTNFGSCAGFCPGQYCPYCNGTDCIRHGLEPCDCDSIDRHELEVTELPGKEIVEGPRGSLLTVVVLLISSVITFVGVVVIAVCILSKMGGRQ